MKMLKTLIRLLTPQYIKDRRFKFRHQLNRIDWFGKKKTQSAEFQDRHDEPRALSEKRWVKETKAHLRDLQKMKDDEPRRLARLEEKMAEKLNRISDAQAVAWLEESEIQPEQHPDYSVPGIKRLPAYKPYQKKA
jgi:hypothetical protein